MKKKDRSYLEVLRKTREFINLNCEDGGWLPSGRKMSELFQTNRRTYFKALKYLENDNTVRAFPRGHKVNPHCLRVRKIGIVIGDASDSPFIKNEKILTAIIDMMVENGFCTQIIQATSDDELLDKVLIHGVKGLIWLCPPKHAFASMSRINESTDLPLLMVSNEYFDDSMVKGIVSVLPIYEKSSEKIVDFVVQRGHEKIAYIVGGHNKLVVRELFSKCLRKTRVKCMFLSYGVSGGTVNLKKISTDSKITALIINGGAIAVIDVFREFSKLKKHSITDLYVHHSKDIETILTMYPDIKVTATGRSNVGALGKEAARIMIEHLVEEKTLESRKVDYFSLTVK